MKLKKMITAVDIHAGTPMRVITGGIIDIPGKTVLEKKIDTTDPFPKGYKVGDIW